MSISDRLNIQVTPMHDSGITTSILENYDKDYRCIAKEMPLIDKETLRENNTDHDIAFNINFFALLKPGEKLTIKKEKIGIENYSQNTINCDSISSKEDLAQRFDKSYYNEFTSLYEELSNEYQSSLNKLKQMRVYIDKKNEEINKLKMDKKYMEGVLEMLKPNNIKLIPKSILIYIILVSMAFCFFLTCFFLNIFTSVSIFHPFIDFILSIGFLGLIFTAFSSVEDIRNTYLKKFNIQGEKDERY